LGGYLHSINNIVNNQKLIVMTTKRNSTTRASYWPINWWPF